MFLFVFFLFGWGGVGGGGWGGERPFRPPLNPPVLSLNKMKFYTTVSGYMYMYLFLRIYFDGKLNTSSPKLLNLYKVCVKSLNP